MKKTFKKLLHFYYVLRVFYERQCLDVEFFEAGNRHIDWKLTRFPVKRKDFPLIPIWTPKLALIFFNFSGILPMGFWGLTGNLPVLYHSEKPKLLTFEVDTISLKVKNKLRSRGNLFLTSSVILPLTPPSIMPSNPASFSTDCQILLSCHFPPSTESEWVQRKIHIISQKRSTTFLTFLYFEWWCHFLPPKVAISCLAPFCESPSGVSL